MVSDAQTQDLVYVALDFETTGLSAARDRVVEAGAASFKLTNRYDCSELQLLSQLIQPLCAIPDEVVAIHGLDESALRGQPRFADFASELMRFLENKVLLAHHAAFDLAFLCCELRRADFPAPDLLVLDTYHLARKVFPQAPGFSLSALCSHLGIEMTGPAHRALPDAQACAALFCKSLQSLEWDLTAPLTNLLERFPQIRVGLGLETIDSPLQKQLEKAILHQQDIKIRYFNAKKELLERRISPLLLGGYGRFAYVEAFCHVRQANRQFRLARIEAISDDFLLDH